ncbi:unnamed protein product, partial [Meganyctiphanes norvegica]
NYQRLHLNKHFTNRIILPRVSEITIRDQIMLLLNKVFNIMTIIVQYLEAWLNNMLISIVKNESEDSKVHHTQLNSAKSPGNALEPSMLFIATLMLLMLPFPPTSSAGTAVPLTFRISPHHLNKFKVIHTLNTCGQATLLKVFKCYKRFPDSKSIKAHLFEDFHMTENEFRDRFDLTMRRVIEHSPASGEEYDISLLIKCLRTLSHYYDRHDSRRKWNDDRELESKCQKLATKRNNVFHSFDGLDQLKMNNEMTQINLLINDIFSSLKLRFPSEVSEISNKNKEIDDESKDILNQPLAEQDIKIYRCQMVLRDQIIPYKNHCKSLGKFKILNFLSVSNNLHDIKLIFTEILIEKSNKFNAKTPVKYTDIINLVPESGILLLDSEAGGGKSTMIIKGVDDWSDGGTEMNTTEFIFLFPMKFRDTHLSSVGELIADLLPEARAKMGTDDIINCLGDSSLKMLFLCDGYDERNDKSIKLFNEICSLKEKNHHIKVILTSRPEAVRDIYDTVGSRLMIEHLKIKGIHENKRKDFLRLYHEEMIRAGMSHENTEELIKFYESCSAQHKDLYRLPINLVILSWLWGQNPQVVKTIRTGAGLYKAILDILKKKLRERVLSKLGIQYIDELMDLTASFENKVFNASLEALKCDRIFIDKAGSDSIMDVCKGKAVPHLELQGAYLLTSLEWNIKLVENLEIPHKGFLDYYAAKCIESKIVHGGKKVKDVLLELYNNDQTEYETQLPKYQNVIQLLGGILALKDPSLIEHHGHDIIAILIQTGIRNNKQWFALFNDLNVSTAAAEKFAKLIAPHLELRNLTIEDADVEALSTLLKYVNVQSVRLNISSAAKLPQLPTLINVLRNNNCLIHTNDLTISDADVEVLSTLLKYVNVQSVTMQISATAIIPQLPSLIDVLRSKNCTIKIPAITDKQIPLWRASIIKETKIELTKIIVNTDQNLSFLNYMETIERCRITNQWRGVGPAAQNMNG